jgi:hypothetical protein
MPRSCFPSTGPRPGALASLHRIPRGSVLRFPRYYHGAPTPAARFASLPSFAKRYHGLLQVARAAGSCCCRLLLGTAPVPQSSAFDSHSWRHAGSPRFLDIPFANSPALRPRRTSHIRPIAMHEMLPSARLTASAPRSVTFRGSITQPARSLSTLRGSDCSDRTRRKTRFPMAASLTGAGLSPAGLHQEVSTLCLQLTSFPLPEASWRTSRRDAVFVG